MKCRHLLSAILAMLPCEAMAAPVPITGTMTYTQNFNSLGTGSPSWVNDSTLPGWYVQINDGTTATGAAQANDGSSSTVSGLLNLGTTGNADRALGSKATSMGLFGNIACAVQFRNTSGFPVQVSQFAYTGELWRTNSTEGGLAEIYTLFYAVSSSPITNIQSGPATAAAAAGSSFSPLGAGANWASPNNLPIASVLNGNTAANRATVTFAPASLVVGPGEYLMFKWTDSNLNGTDGCQGVDDVSVQFTSLADIPEIVVEQPPLINIPDGGTVDFGKVQVNGSASLTFRIRNVGSVELNEMETSIDGPNAADFTITSPPAPEAAPGGSTNFTVRFTPSVAGSKLALLHISSNDSDENPFDIILSGTVPLAGEVDAGFNPGINGFFTGGTTEGFCQQLDGKIVISGTFDKVGTVTRVKLARLNPDGSLDAGFNPAPNNYVQGLGVMADGRAYVAGNFTSVGGASRTYFARLNTNGTADAAFNPVLSLDANALTIQPDGMVIAAGAFKTVNGVSKNYMVRYSPAGVLDTTFLPAPNSVVTVVRAQPDGRIIIGGAFGSVSGTLRIGFARVLANGSLDTTYSDGNLGATPFVVALQADGKILVGGDFPWAGGALSHRMNLARYDVNGVVDTTYNPNPNGQVSSIAVQADGKIIIGGNFTTVSGVTKNSVARLNPNGSVDPTFTADAGGGFDPSVECAGLTPAGQVIILGFFTSINGVARANIARVENDAAISEVSAPSTTKVRWMRVGTSPEVYRVDFEMSTDGGNSWSPLGTGTRIAGGWERTTFALPATGLVRARAVVTQGEFSFPVESVASFTFAPEINVEQPAGTALSAGAAIVDFGDLPPEATLTKSFVIKNSGTGPLTGVALTVEGTDAVDFTVTAAPANTVGQGTSTSFDIRFAPTTPGAKSAMLKIASNDSDENPYSISLQGNRIPTALESWRLTHFGTMLDAGDAASNADPDMDTVDNLLEFAFGLNPEMASAKGLPSWVHSGEDYVLSFTEPAEAAGITYIAEYSTTLAPGGWTVIPNSSVPPLHTYIAPSGITGRIYLRMRITAP